MLHGKKSNAKPWNDDQQISSNHDLRAELGHFRGWCDIGSTNARLTDRTANGQVVRIDQNGPYSFGVLTVILLFVGL